LRKFGRATGVLVSVVRDERQQIGYQQPRVMAADGFGLVSFVWVSVPYNRPDAEIQRGWSVDGGDKSVVYHLTQVESMVSFNCVFGLTDDEVIMIRSGPAFKRLPGHTERASSPEIIRFSHPQKQPPIQNYAFTGKTVSPSFAPCR